MKEPWKFRKTEERKLLRAVEAIRHIIRMGYECQNEARDAERAVEHLLRLQGRPAPRGPFGTWIY